MPVIRETKPETLSPKAIKNIHGVLHKALQQAMLNGLIRNNPADPCVLLRRPKQKVKPLNEEQITKLIKALKGHKYENLILTTLFTGLREGEVCSLQWVGRIQTSKAVNGKRKATLSYTSTTQMAMCPHPSGCVHMAMDSPTG